MIGKYDIIVIGGGHAGCEAALASARMGAKTLLLTLSIENVALMPCNPAIGGLGKGNLVKDLDALGGEMGKNIDATGIQFRILNRSKGTAVRSTRAQADKYLYKERMLAVITSTGNLDLKQGIVAGLIVDNKTVKGVEVLSGEIYHAEKIIVTAGTFLNGEIFIGDMRMKAGRMYEPAATALSDSLKSLGFIPMRLKTDTPARVNIDSVDTTGLETFSSDNERIRFSSDDIENNLTNIDCYLTYTNETTCKIIADNIHRSMLYNGTTSAVGPRYCPSIEDKVTKFPDKTAHNVVIEPEGLNTKECHVNGLSTSLPYDVQLLAYRSIKGLEHVEFTRPGYAIQYDVYDPRDLKYNYESKLIGGLFFAGQVNGTSGYEEAAIQGYMAGVNAVLSIDSKEPFILRRDESYIGVLTDDIISKGIDEPYRMFTSRGEYRLQLREQKAEDRLIKYGYDLGLISGSRYKRYLSDVEIITAEISRLKKKSLILTDSNRDILNKFNINYEKQPTFADFLRRPEVDYNIIRQLDIDINIDTELAKKVESEIKYEGYILKQEREIAKKDSYDNMDIPSGLDYHNIAGLRFEYAEKIIKRNPKKLSEIASISGVAISAISVIAIEIMKQSKNVSRGTLRTDSDNDE